MSPGRVRDFADHDRLWALHRERSTDGGPYPAGPGVASGVSALKTRLDKQAAPPADGGLNLPGLLR